MMFTLFISLVQDWPGLQASPRSPPCVLLLWLAMSWKELPHHYLFSPQMLASLQRSGQENQLRHVGTNQVTLSNRVKWLAPCTYLHNGDLACHPESLPAICGIPFVLLTSAQQAPSPLAHAGPWDATAVCASAPRSAARALIPSAPPAADLGHPDSECPTCTRGHVPLLIFSLSPLCAVLHLQSFKAALHQPLDFPKCPLPVFIFRFSFEDPITKCVGGGG